MASPIGVRCVSGKRRQAAVSSSVKPNVATISTAERVVDRQRDHAGVGAEQLAPLAERHVVDRLAR